MIAEAKELEDAQICGRSGCIEITDAQRLEQLPVGAIAAPPAGSFYVLSFTVWDGGSVPEHFAMYYVASERLLAANGATPGSLTWFPATEQAVAALETAIARIEPFPHPSAWPAELKSPARVAALNDAVTEGASGSGVAWPLVTSSLMVALLLGFGSFAIVRRSRPPRADSV